MVIERKEMYHFRMPDKWQFVKNASSVKLCGSLNLEITKIWLETPLRCSSICLARARPGVQAPPPGEKKIAKKYFNAEFRICHRRKKIMETAR